MRFQAEEGTDSLTVGGQRYKVEEDGTFECDNNEHFSQLRQLGCRGEGEHVHRGPVVASEPPAVPEGLVSEEAVRALIEENEDQKVAIGKLNGENHQLTSDLEASHNRVTALEGELSSARSVEDELRNRVQELTSQLDAATNNLSDATEKATESAIAGASGESATATEKTTDEAPPATGKAKAK